MIEKQWHAMVGACWRGASLGPNIPQAFYFDWFSLVSVHGSYYYSGYGGMLCCWDSTGLLNGHIQRREETAAALAILGLDTGGYR
jgi:hypothetical protein